MEYLEIVSVPAIAAIVYLVIVLIKSASNQNEIFKRFIPLLSGALGAVLGVICFYTLPQIIAAENVFIAIISGAASGLCATGCHQIFKQMGKSIGVDVKIDGINNKEESEKAEDIFTGDAETNFEEDNLQDVATGKTEAGIEENDIIKV